MIIPIKRGNDLQEWAIVELQGDLKFDSAEVTNKYIGDLHFSKSGTAILVIGIHVLHGKEIPLSKPYAVLVKKTYEQDDEEPAVKVAKTEYIVEGIVRKKLIFKTRPKPIATNVAKSTLKFA